MAKYVVRYGNMRSLGIMGVRGRDAVYQRGDRVVARTKRGLETGEILCEATPSAVKQIRDPSQGEILRSMSSDDANEHAHMQAREGDEFATCLKYVKQLGLQMELVDLEHVFGGERIVVYYLAEQRVDFRELVRQLAKEFQTRIEMRQIGVRDEAKLLADYGDCGKPVCCNTHLSTMPPVSMKMAKLQKATLDPTKISGRCGRLKCCLRYEYDTYERMQKELPRVGAEVLTDQGQVRILGQEILTQQLLVEKEDKMRVVIHVSEVLSVIRDGKGRGRREKGKSDNGSHADKAESSDGKKSGPRGQQPPRPDEKNGSQSP
ncbi:MAG: signal peptidase [Planctomycetales bacterium]|nr:signal peptidase [Planctomycetales bacterium]